MRHEVGCADPLPAPAGYRRLAMRYALLLLSLLSLPSFAHAEENQAFGDAPKAADFSILYEGRTRGLSGATARLSADPQVAEALAALPPEQGWHRTAAGFGAFLRDDRWLLQPAEGVRRFLETSLGTITAEGDAPRPVQALLTDQYAIFAWPPSAAEEILPVLEQALSAQISQPRPVRRGLQARSYAIEGGHDFLLVSPKRDPRGLSAPLSPNAWETRLRSVFEGKSADGQPARIYVVARLEGEGSRRLRLLQKWSERPSLYLASGDSLEGASFLSDEPLSLQRPITWAAWKQQGLFALAPGSNELLAGVEGLKEEARAAGVLLLSVNAVGEDGAPLFARWALAERGGRRIAVLGWTPPSALDALPPEARAGITLRGEAALHDALRELWADPTAKPDLVVVFGDGASSIAGRIPGVDLVLGDFQAELRLPRSEEVDESALRAHRRDGLRTYGPALVPRLGPGMLGRVDVRFDPDSGVLTQLRHIRAYISEDQPVELDSILKLQGVRQRVFAAAEDVLIPEIATLAEPEGLQKWRHAADVDRLDEGAFARLVANLLMDRTGADLALLRPLPHPLDGPGATQELYVDAALAFADEVVYLVLTGAQLKRLLLQLKPVIPKPGAAADIPTDGARWAWTAGLKHGRKPMVRGRTVGDGDYVRVATTRFFTEDPALRAALAKVLVRRLWRGEGWTREPTIRGGEPWGLHKLVLEGLQQIRETDPDFGAAYSRALHPFLAEQNTNIAPRFVLELDGIGLQVVGSVSDKQREGYGNSNEGRVNQPDSLSATLRGRVAAVYSDRIGSLTAAIKGAFGRTRLPAEEEGAEPPKPVELEDDLVVSAEGRLRLLSVPVGSAKVRLSSFASTEFDTEWAAQDDPVNEGQKLDRQRIHRISGGATLGKFGMLKELKIGLLLENDLNAEVGAFAPGGAVKLTTDKRWGPIRWANLADFRGYFPTKDDSDADLAFRLNLRSDLGVTPFKHLLPGLSIGAFADILLFQGQLAINRNVGVHALLGATLSYDMDLSPPLRLR